MGGPNLIILGSFIFKLILNYMCELYSKLHKHQGMSSCVSMPSHHVKDHNHVQALSCQSFSFALHNFIRVACRGCSGKHLLVLALPLNFEQAYNVGTWACLLKHGH